MGSPATDIMYLFSKGYMNGLAGPQGVANGSASTIKDPVCFMILADVKARRV
jgi:hypothetical protein